MGRKRTVSELAWKLGSEGREDAEAGDGRIEALNPEKANHFRQMRQLEDNPDLAWERMTGAQPALKQVEADIRAAGAERPSDRFEAVDNMRAVLGDRLTPLVGPKAVGVTDPFLRTWAAQEMADRYLVRAYGLRDEEVYVGMHKLIGHVSSDSKPQNHREAADGGS